MENEQAEKEIVYEPLDELLYAFDEDNPKDHDIGTIVASIRRHGFRGSVIRDSESTRLAAGHGRCEALAWMRAQGEREPEGILPGWLAPVTYEEFPSEDERLAYAVGDNQTTILGGWNTRTLIANLERLAAAPKRWEGTGFDGDDLDHFKSLIGEAAAPAPAQSPGLDRIKAETRYGITANLRSEMEEDECASLLEAHGYSVERHSDGEGRRGSHNPARS